MNEKKYNDEIEILDGLDDFFGMPKNNETKEEPSFTFNEELSKPSEEEVLNVLEEPVVDMSKIENENKVNNDTPFTSFVPDNIEMLNQEEPSLMKDSSSTVTETTEKEEIPSMDEIFYMDFDNFGKKDETSDDDLQKVDNANDSLNNEKIESVVNQPIIEQNIKEEPIFNEVSSNNVEQSNNNLSSVPNEVEDLDKTNFYLDDILEPISLEENKQEDNKSIVNDNIFNSNINLEPLKTETNDLDKTNFDINYTFADQVETNNVDNSIDNAFNFEVESDLVNNNSNNSNSNNLGKTVIIEPVDLKPVEKDEVRQEEVKSEEPVKVEDDKKFEETKINSNNQSEMINKKDGRFFVLILLIVMLLLSFVILLPTIIEKFAI